MSLMSNIWNVLSVVGTNEADIKPKGVLVRRFFVFRRLIAKGEISRLVLTTFVKKRPPGAPGLPPSASYCAAECTDGKVRCFRVTNPQNFRFSAKKQGIPVQSMIRTSTWIGMGQ
jgi:hypothetical protein